MFLMGRSLFARAAVAAVGRAAVAAAVALCVALVCLTWSFGAAAQDAGRRGGDGGTALSSSADAGAPAAPQADGGAPQIVGDGGTFRTPATEEVVPRIALPSSEAELSRNQPIVRIDVTGNRRVSKDDFLTYLHESS